MKKLLIVSSTRRTKIGTLRPGIVYTLDGSKPKIQEVLTWLTEGKDSSGVKRTEPIGKILTQDEADKFMASRAQEQAKELSLDKEAQAEGKGAINTANLTGLSQRADKAEAKVKSLEDQLQAAKEIASASQTRAETAEKDMADQSGMLEASESSIASLNTLVADLKKQAETAEVELVAKKEDLKTSEDRVSGLTVEVADLKEQLEQAAAALDAANKPATDTAKGKGK